MIFLYCSTVPEGFDTALAKARLKELFIGETNGKYFDEIADRRGEIAKESLFAYSLLADAIVKNSVALRYGGEPLTFIKKASGKPYFRNSHIKFNLSHSNGQVVCAISSGCEIGVDVEANSPSPEKACKLAKRFLSDNDAKTVSSYPSLFARLWTKKEASVKLLGVNFADESQIVEKNGLETKLIFHFFKYEKTPITLCTERDFEKIIFLATDP